MTKRRQWAGNWAADLMRRHSISSLALTLEVKYSALLALTGERRSTRSVLRLLRSFRRLGEDPGATVAAAAAEIVSAAMQASTEKCRGMMLPRCDSPAKLCTVTHRILSEEPRIASRQKNTANTGAVAIFRPRQRAAAMRRDAAIVTPSALHTRDHTHIKLGGPHDCSQTQLPTAPAARTNLCLAFVSEGAGTHKQARSFSIQGP